MSPETTQNRPLIADNYALPPMAFAKAIGLIPPRDPHGALSYDGLLALALHRYYDHNTHLARPLRLAS